MTAMIIAAFGVFVGGLVWTGHAGHQRDMDRAFAIMMAGFVMLIVLELVVVIGGAK